MDKSKAPGIFYPKTGRASHCHELYEGEMSTVHWTLGAACMGLKTTASAIVGKGYEKVICAHK